ncbi:AAA family ATPase [uncultured Brachyspira sp.]|uniref:AAA family ATPase n=1 Tax=uncultured Brachyspira sp. TaxID=221953 RepID=UPI002635F19D|nr:AAA family ATPase [uncultured Brachyspira sp.]
MNSLLLTLDFRRFPSIKNINFFVGKNNCGKTSVLEAIMLMSAITDFSMPYYINNLRTKNDNNELTLTNIFRNFDYKNNIKFEYKIKNNLNYKLNIKPILEYNNNISGLEYNLIFNNINKKIKKKYEYSYKNISSIEKDILKINSNIKGIYIPSVLQYKDLMHNITKIIKNKKNDKLTEMISFFDSKIKDINVLNNSIYMNIENINELVNINLIGDGVIKYLHIIASIISDNFNTILADEIENGLHHKSIIHLLKTIFRLSKDNNIQMFFTTHSYEVLKFIYYIINDNKEFYDIKDEVNIINIVNTKNKGFKAYNYDILGIEELLKNDADIRY